MTRKRAVLIGAGLFVGSAAGAAFVFMVVVALWLHHGAQDDDGLWDDDYDDERDW